jgi:DNA-binding XRE family transcriptional regulator
MFDRSLDKVVSDRIRLLMREQNWNNKDLADFLGISQSSIHDIMVGISPWKIWQVATISEFFCVTLDYLIYGDVDFIKNRVHRKTIELQELIERNKDNPSEIARVLRLIENEKVLSSNKAAEPDGDLYKATKLIKKGKNNE